MKIPRFIILLLLTIFISCNETANNEKKGFVTITGIIDNYNRNNTDLYLYLEQPGNTNVRQLISIDSTGHFFVHFRTYTALGAMLLEKNTFTNINFVYHPDDSINVHFSANNKQIPLMKSVKFTGDASETNNQILQFQIEREKNKLGYDAINPQTAYKLNENDFLKMMSGIKQQQITLANSFINANFISKEAQIWIKEFAIQTYYYYMWDYSTVNKISETYNDYNNDILSFSKRQLICWNIIKNRIKTYYSYLLKPRMIREFAPIMKDIQGGKLNTDSLVIDFISKNSENKLLDQLIIANYYTTQFNARNITGYERNRQLLESINYELFIRNSLRDNYEKTYRQINKPAELTNMVLKKIENTPIEETINMILSENKGKVIYLDCWATYCQFCRKEMPHSKELMKNLKNKNLSFVYVCIDSKEKIWKSLLSDFNIEGGQHYLLNKEQSKYFRNVMNIQGIPCYFLIDKKGRIIEQGSHLRPSEKQTEIKIRELLNK